VSSGIGISVAKMNLLASLRRPLPPLLTMPIVSTDVANLASWLQQTNKYLLTYLLLSRTEGYGVQQARKPPIIMATVRAALA